MLTQSGIFILIVWLQLEWKFCPLTSTLWTVHLTPGCAVEIHSEMDWFISVHIIRASQLFSESAEVNLHINRLSGEPPEVCSRLKVQDIPEAERVTGLIRRLRSRIW